MGDIFLWMAGGLAALWLCVHLFVGGRDVAQPMMKTAELDPMVRHTQYLCWHFTSVTIAAIALFFVWAALTGTIAYATAATLLATAFFAVGVGLVSVLGESHVRLPQGWLFLPVAALGVAGHVI